MPAQGKDNVIQRIFCALQCILPHHLLSRVAGRLADSRVKLWKSFLIRVWIRCFDVDMSEAERTRVCEYHSFNDFFTRALKPGVRPFPDKTGILASPADGTVSAAGIITEGRLLQAKNRVYTHTQLLAGDKELARTFDGGAYFTLYLAPGDYHRVHMPCDGTLRKTIYVPGRLFSVNRATSRHVAQLFARNERLICLFDTPHGPLALIMVGAMLVAGIETTWDGPRHSGRRHPGHPGVMRTISHDLNPPVTLRQGDEAGRFKLGSTVIVLTASGQVKPDDAVQPGTCIRTGQDIARAIRHPGDCVAE